MSTGRFIDYTVRPEKQIERRIIIDTLNGLGQCGFRISNYRYVGFGSFYFYDFKLFHKYVGIDDFISFEIDTDAIDRCKFNKPYSNIKILEGRIADNPKSISGKKQSIIWVDYEGFISDEDFNEIELITSTAPHGTVLIITTTAELPKTVNDRASYTEYYEKYFEEHIGDGLKKPVSFANVSHRKTLSHQLTYEAINKGIRLRTDNLEFQNLFQFTYSDSTKMLSVGGIICNADECLSISEHFKGKKYLHLEQSEKFYSVYYPKLTRKEKILIDSRLPKLTLTKKLQALKCVRFGKYKEIYRFTPSYAELIDD